jgi:hypothetical protein
MLVHSDRLPEYGDIGETGGGLKSVLEALRAIVRIWVDEGFTVQPGLLDLYSQACQQASAGDQCAREVFGGRRLLVTGDILQMAPPRDLKPGAEAIYRSRGISFVETDMLTRLARSGRGLIICEYMGNMRFVNPLVGEFVTQVRLGLRNEHLAAQVLDGSIAGKEVPVKFVDAGPAELRLVGSRRDAHAHNLRATTALLQCEPCCAELLGDDARVLAPLPAGRQGRCTCGHAHVFVVAASVEVHDASASRGACFKCGRVGHFAAQCQGQQGVGSPAAPALFAFPGQISTQFVGGNAPGGGRDAADSERGYVQPAFGDAEFQSDAVERRVAGSSGMTEGQWAGLLLMRNLLWRKYTHGNALTAFVAVAGNIVRFGENRGTVTTGAVGYVVGVDDATGEVHVSIDGTVHIAAWREQREVVQWTERHGWTVMPRKQSQQTPARGARGAGGAPDRLRLVFRYMMLVGNQAQTLASLQGCEYSGVQVYLPVNRQNMFSGGMTYMGLSRPRDYALLTVVGDEGLDWSSVTYDVPSLSFVRVLAYGVSLPWAPSQRTCSQWRRTGRVRGGRYQFYGGAGPAVCAALGLPTAEGSAPERHLRIGGGPDAGGAGGPSSATGYDGPIYSARQPASTNAGPVSGARADATAGVAGEGANTGTGPPCAHTECMGVCGVAMRAEPRAEQLCASCAPVRSTAYDFADRCGCDGCDSLFADDAPPSRGGAMFVDSPPSPAVARDASAAGASAAAEEDGRAAAPAAKRALTFSTCEVDVILDELGVNDVDVAALFARHKISQAAVLRGLTEDDMRELGVPMGVRIALRGWHAQ